MTIDIPQEELYVSKSELEGDVLSIRFVGNHHPGYISWPPAFCIKATTVINADAVAQFLADRCIANEALYLVGQDKRIKVDSEYGLSIEVRAASLEWFGDNLNEEELNRIISRTYGWYEAEQKAFHAATHRINAARQLIQEQIRRIDVKAKTHTQGSTASTLYTQQRETLLRIFAALELPLP